MAENVIRLMKETVRWFDAIILNLVQKPFIEFKSF